MATALSALEFTSNFYKPLTGLKQRGENPAERAFGGYDYEIGMQIPYMPSTRLFAKRFVWKSESNASDLTGYQYALQFKSFLKDNRFNNSLITGTENIETSFYKVGISIPNLLENVDLKVEYTKPLFISRGLINLALPVYRDRYFNLYTEEVSLALSPDHQETITSISLNKFTGNSSMAFRLENVENPYHGNIYKDYLNFSLGFKYLF